MTMHRRGRLAGATAILLNLVGTAVCDNLSSHHFLRLDYSTRDVSMAGAAIGVPNGIYGFQSNPAATGFLSNPQAAAGARSYAMDLWAGLLAGSMPVKSTGVWTVGVVNLSEGSLNEVNEHAESTGRVWKAGGFAGSLTWAKVLWRNLSFGASFKGIYYHQGSGAEQYSYPAVALDCGAQWRFLQKRLVVGLAARNMGLVVSTKSSGGQRYPLPASVGAGMSYVPYYVKNLRFALDLEKAAEQNPILKPGLEIYVIPNMLCIRGGFPFTTRDFNGKLISSLKGEDNAGYVKEDFRTLCLGFGLNLPYRNIDLATDAAVEFHTGFDPSVGATLQVGFRNPL